jgi:formate hydrogenlyase transcriptional activator
MTEPTSSNSDPPLEASIPEGAVSVESILCTEELSRRPSRPPDYKQENRALQALASTLADAPSTILQTLAETILWATDSDSSGLSLLAPDGKTFYWPAIAGRWKPHIGGGTPRNFGPCGDVLDRNKTLLFRHFERRYSYFLPVTPLAEECLLVPFYVSGKAVGTIWAIMHDDRRKFDAEDARVMSTLGKFASSAYQAVALIDDLQVQIAERVKVETALRDLTDTLEARVRVRTTELEREIAERRKSQDALRTAMTRFEGILAIADDAIISVDSHQRIILFNQGAEKVFGYAGNEAIGKPLDFLVPQRCASAHRKHVEAFARSSDIARKVGERRGIFGVRKDGREFPAEASISKLHLDGNLIFTVILRDVTERKQAEDRIRQDERELRDIVETIPALVLVLTPDGSLLYANRRLLDYTGLTEEGLPNGNFRGVIFHPHDVESLGDQRREGLARGDPFQLEQRLRAKDGQYRWILTHYNPLSDGQGRILRWYVTGIDIDDRKRAEERVHDENRALREEVDKASMFEEIVGTSVPLRSVLSYVSKVAPIDSTVLITGETGTGKELIARAIHRRSARGSRAFITVNCAAIPASLIASELFGHEKGAFTGALQRRVGRFELAQGGTLFLDEVGELPPDMQVVLLRVLQEGEFERVGGSQLIQADVRLIAATNRDLKAAVAAGTFRSDLFYRLNVFPIEMPPLRERREDLLMLSEYFIHRYSGKLGKKVTSISQKTLELFHAYAWPGNIRELQNVIERSFIVCDSETLSVDPSWLAWKSTEAGGSTQPLSTRLAVDEKAMIEAALAESRGRVAGPLGAAIKLGMPASTLESKIRALKINKHLFKSIQES